MYNPLPFQKKSQPEINLLGWAKKLFITIAARAFP
jgi:hypothetical protein